MSDTRIEVGMFDYHNGTLLISISSLVGPEIMRTVSFSWLLELVYVQRNVQWDHANPWPVFLHGFSPIEVHSESYYQRLPEDDEAKEEILKELGLDQTSAEDPHQSLHSVINWMDVQEVKKQGKEKTNKYGNATQKILFLIGRHYVNKGYELEVVVEDD